MALKSGNSQQFEVNPAVGPCHWNRAATNPLSPRLVTFPCVIQEFSDTQPAERCCVAALPARFRDITITGTREGLVTLITPMCRNPWLPANCLSKLLTIGGGLDGFASATGKIPSNTSQCINQGIYSEEIISSICSLAKHGICVASFGPTRNASRQHPDYSSGRLSGWR